MENKIKNPHVQEEEEEKKEVIWRRTLKTNVEIII